MTGNSYVIHKDSPSSPSTPFPDRSIAQLPGTWVPMATSIPSIACLGVIGRHNKPLHMTIFSSYPEQGQPARTPLQFSLLLSTALDVFEMRHSGGNGTLNPSSNSNHSLPNINANRNKNLVMVSGDLGLLHAVDERLALYGFETNTGTKFVAVVDMQGRRGLPGQGGDGMLEVVERKTKAAVMMAVGLREVEVRSVFKAMQTAYIKLLQNPFYDPDEHSPLLGRGGKMITSRKFAEDMRRIGERWAPGMMDL